MIRFSDPASSVAETKSETKPSRETKLSVARKAVETKPKGGRPRKHDGEPWKAEGVSRASWYRRKAKRGASDE